MMNLCFKGNRSYIHGSDIYSYILNFAQVNHSTLVDSIDISYRKRSQKVMKVQTTAPSSMDSLVFTCTIVVGGQKVNYYGVDTQEEVVNRYSYDESSIAALSIINEDSISLQEPSGFSFIENVLALNKLLLHNKVDESGKWYLTKITVKKPVETEYQFPIELRCKRIRNDNFAQVEILVKQQIVGHLYSYLETQS